jgi:hypothetical protein
MIDLEQKEFEISGGNDRLEAEKVLQEKAKFYKLWKTLGL